MSQDDDGIDLAAFFDDHSSLFVVLGVFSALAIYISDLGTEPLETAPLQIRIGFAGSLILSLLLLLVIYREMVKQVGSAEALFKAHTDFKNWDLMIFTAGAAFLLPSLVTPLLQQVSTLYYVLGFLGLIFSLPVIFNFVIWIDNQLREEGIVRSVQEMVVLVFVYWVASQYAEYVTANPQLTGANSFSLTNLAPVFFDITASIALIAQGVAGLIAVVNGLQLMNEVGDVIRKKVES